MRHMRSSDTFSSAFGSSASFFSPPAQLGLVLSLIAAAVLTMILL